MRTRAAGLHEYGAPWSVENIELDPPRAGKVLVQLAAEGLCHSDEHVRHGLIAAPKDDVSSLGLPAMSPTIGARGLRHRHRGW
jgi:D-arabinose 1-dehydrogenase-like Zn-dependent alcohol dehydrogenase